MDRIFKELYVYEIKKLFYAPYCWQNAGSIGADG